MWLVCPLLLWMSSYPVHAFYNPATGRWLSRDPIGEKGGKNLAAFVRNEPVTHVDLFGLYANTSADLPEKAACLWDCGQTAARTAASFANQAGRLAQTRYPNNVLGGIGDAYRHCLWSCMMAKFLGQDCAAKIAENHENGNDRRAEQTPADRQMDTANNAAGRNLAKQGDNCPGMCAQAADDGKLTTLR